uniref:Reverse transcriptase (RNA-dependent DNA polymerase) n=1 Tax=Candidatus Kentrum sp. LPFa TaxID=2126335 RepID=A0A450X7L1_9GAMM|nr:MAG: hypothetical protein BECKLPF1236B_GA0070989_14691 [Candidatus Kentron sp. LPFa]
MREAFKNVKHNRGAAGIDKVSVQMFEAPINKIPDENLDALMRDLKTRGKFQPKPLRRVVIPKDKENMYWVRERLAPLPPRCREGVDSPHLPTCPFRASGDSARSTPFGELCVLIYAG